MIKKINLTQRNNMKLEQQVCSLELAKRLKELEVKQESLYVWQKGYFIMDDKKLEESDYWRITTNQKNVLRPAIIRPYDVELSKIERDSYSAFTTAELGNLIGAGLNTKINMSGNIVVFHTLHEGGFTADTEADARAKMLIYLLENKLTPASQDKE